MFQFFVEDQLISQGNQQLVFADHNKKIQKLPEDILEKIQSYELVQEERPRGYTLH
jgi:hypothetical protein